MVLYQMVLHLVKFCFAVSSIRRFYNYPEKLKPLLSYFIYLYMYIYLSPRLGSIRLTAKKANRELISNADDGDPEDKAL